MLYRPAGEDRQCLARSDDIRRKTSPCSDNRGLDGRPTACQPSEARAGEVLGIAAIEGNGQSELLEAITGMRPAIEGRVRIRGTEQDAWPHARRRFAQLGLAHVPEDRLATGLERRARSVADNLHGRASRREPRVQRPRPAASARASIERYASGALRRNSTSAARAYDAPVGSMSGGNMQKVVVAREFSFDDAGARSSRSPPAASTSAPSSSSTPAILDKRNEGCAILLCSADLDEVFRLSDRVITMYEGQDHGRILAPTEITPRRDRLLHDRRTP